MIKQVFPFEDVIVHGIPDLTTEDDITTEWGDYLLDYARELVDEDITAMCYGNDEPRSRWFRKERIKQIEEIIIPRSEINATRCRQLMAMDQQEIWNLFHPVEVHPYYHELREELLLCSSYRDQLW